MDEAAFGIEYLDGDGDLGNNVRDSGLTRPEEVMEMLFNSPDEAARFYEQYSRGKGFAMRVGKKLRNKNGDIVRYTYLCNREGFRQKKWVELEGRKREHKVVTRCGCMAEMHIKQNGQMGKWYVSRFVDDHNHELLPPKLVEYLPPHRKMSDVDVAHMDSLRQVGISVPKIYESLAAQAGGFDHIPFTKRDMYNEVRRQRGMRKGDVNATIRYFEAGAKADEKLFWRCQVSADQHMCDLFWCDGRSQDDYKIFGDVLAFDATYGRNKYNLPVIIFSGVNHHNQTCVFGAAMVSCETQATYVWVLQKLLECMEGKAPKAVITDGDRSMRMAINEVFPEAHHRLCAWHLLKNATTNVCLPRFTTLFRYCMLADIEIEEFEQHWEAMLDECGVRDVEWVQDTYRNKLYWATAYIRGRFFAGIRTTSRCESLHAKLGRFVERRYGILNFVTNFQRCVEFLRDNEDEMDFRSSYGTPVLQTQFPELEKSGAMKYTREIFSRFRESLKRCVRITVVESQPCEGSTIYVTQKYMRPGRKWNVMHVLASDKYTCSCQRMESFGLPCVHILSVLVRLDVGSLPDTLVLERWTKSAKFGLYDDIAGDKMVDIAALYRMRMETFLQHCKRLARLICNNDDLFKLYTEQIVQEATNLESMNDSGNSVGVGGGGNNGRVLDPIGVRTKGTGRGNVQVGARGVKRRKCSTCGVVGHRRTQCPNRANMSVPNSQYEVPQMVSQSAARAEFPPVKNIGVQDCYRPSAADTSDFRAAVGGCSPK
ncbi:protein FAR1-RELATED SEQUENCE 5 [Arachis hypogaea]|uniref:protein FAR1-RELATED SEQUENCE 5 n=1 Tax=Arachis hypogaea TaxID=3818 RepID=UPI000DEC5756|nr:protein FAR1-RELATED SEQUENCE 5 [Arachis hypogaea]